MAVQSFDRLSAQHKQKIEAASQQYQPSSAPLILHGIATFLGLPAAGVALLGRVSIPNSNVKAVGLAVGAFAAVVAFAIHFYKFNQKQDRAMINGLSSLITLELGLKNHITVEYNGKKYTLYVSHFFDKTPNPNKTVACKRSLSDLLDKSF
jgi:hypothetical protein